MHAMTTRIFLADDHLMFRDALCNLLHTHAGMEVVGQTGDGLQVAVLCTELAPDIVCMDIHMPGMDGIKTTHQLRQTCPHIKVIALSAYTDQHYVLDMLAAGAKGYVTKAEASDELLHAMRVVQAGGVYLCPDVAGAFSGAPHALLGGEKPAVSLSTRERQVAQGVALGHTSAQIATALFIAPSTVEVHRRNIMRKLNLRNVADLTRYVLGQADTPQ